MKNITVLLRVEPYLRQWLVHAFGEPVRFPSQSYENHLLLRLVQRVPCMPPIVDETSAPHRCVKIVIPDSAQRRPEYYHHLSRRANAKMCAALVSLFRIHLWSDLAPQIHGSASLNRSIDEWCQRQGIDIDYREGVRQKFYRMRRSYEAYGIILGKKHCHKRGKK